MKSIDKYLYIITKRIISKVYEKDIKTVIPIIMPESKQIIGYLNL